MHSYAWGLAGGVLLGAAAALLLMLNGRILGISGVLGGAMRVRSPEARWRWAFLVGILLAGAATFAMRPVAFANTLDRSLEACAFAGVLVGVGTQLGSGCTSGHGICGIGRASPRSIAATLIFIAAGAASVVAVRDLFGGCV